MAKAPATEGHARPDHTTAAGRAARRRRCAWACLLVGLGAQCGEEPPAPPRAPEPQRVVACSPEVAQLLVELGAGGAIVAADSLSILEVPVGKALDLGPGCARAPDAAPAIAPALAILLGAGGDEALAAALAERGLETLVLGPRSANEVVAAHQRVAARLGIPTRSLRSVAHLTQEISAIATSRDGLPRLAVVWIVARDPLVAVGSGGMLHEILELAGANNAFHGGPEDRRDTRVDEVVASAPDLVLDSSGSAEPLPLPRNLRVLRIVPDLATIPALDLAARVRALHAALYPDSPASRGSIP